MYVTRNIAIRNTFWDSWRFLLAVVLWSSLIVVLHEWFGFTALAVPALPVGTIGIAVSLYLGFKSKASYDRWWEARKIWGQIVNDSRTWGNMVKTYAPDDVAKELIYRHMAWMNALAFQLRKTSRLKPSQHLHMFDYRLTGGEDKHHGDPESYLKFLDGPERDEMAGYQNPATQIVMRQGDRLKELVKDGALDTFRHVSMTERLASLYDNQGKCERIKNTPFPRQVAYFGAVFTWIFVLLTPLALVDSIAAEIERFKLTGSAEVEYLLILVPFSAVIGWVFIMMEKISDSHEDPFEGGPTDVSISALCRVIEIDLREALGETDIPPKLEPVNGVLY